MSLLDKALEYRRRGWSVIPVKEKKAALRSWKPYQTQLPTERELKSWFARGGVTGLAVVLGPGSGGLYCRDFDKAGAYERWAQEHLHLSALLPTSCTAKGHHVYARSEGKFPVKNLGDGELRGLGGYVLLPPSLHPSGTLYQWNVQPPTGDVPTVEPAAAGFDRAWSDTEGTEGTERTEQTEANRADRSGKGVGVGVTCQVLESRIAGIVKLALPSGRGQNHRCLFTLARGVKSIEQERGRDLTLSELCDVFTSWHTSTGAKGHLRPDQSRDAYWFEFLEAHEHAKYPLGEGVLMQAWTDAKKSEPPKVAVKWYETPELWQVVALCRELQRASGENPFFLSCRTLQRLLHKPTHATANRWLMGLERNEIIRCVERGGSHTNKANRFRYLHPLDE